jgi:branched-chain amino acid aminotransferase
VFVNTEKKLIWKNGSFEKWDDSNVHILSHTLHYGTGVFEGVRAYKTDLDQQFLGLKEHTSRLFNAAAKINIKIPFSEEEINKAQCEALNKK